MTPDSLLGVAPIPQTGGTASLAWGLVGLEVFAQALVFSSAGGDRLTNVNRDVVRLPRLPVR